MTASPEKIIRDFCAAWERVDVEAVMGFFTDDAVYHNIPVEPMVGKEAIRGMIAMFTTGVERMEFRILNLVTDGDLVLTERLDIFYRAEGNIELPVMGTFELRDGLIAKWRDYFDLNTYMQQIGM